MRLLARLADATAGLSGGALAGAVYAHAQHGDPFVHAYMSRLLGAACVPLFEMMQAWVFEGQLQDPHREFFVVASRAGGFSRKGRGERIPAHQAQGLFGGFDTSELISCCQHKVREFLAVASWAGRYCRIGGERVFMPK